jgi:divalent metal cation (Fe/Co/Zn/Cd) transporter
MTASRPDLVRRALRLEWLTIAWLVIEAAVALGAGIAAHSLSLIAFGADSLIELASAGVLSWRLGVELQRGADFPEAVERRAGKIAAGLLFVLGLYVAAGAGYGLWRGEGQAFSVPGLAVTLASMPVMLLLAREKRRVAERLGSTALRVDAVESLACLYLSAVVLLGLLAQLLLAAWWVDGAASLAIVVLLAREAREAWSGDRD